MDAPQTQDLAVQSNKPYNLFPLPHGSLLTHSCAPKSSLNITSTASKDSHSSGPEILGWFQQRSLSATRIAAETNAAVFGTLTQL